MFDYKNPVWVEVKDNAQVEWKRCILYQEHADGSCTCIDNSCIDNVLSGKSPVYRTMLWRQYRHIKEPTYRPFKDFDEFLEHIKTTGRHNLLLMSIEGDLIMPYPFNKYSNWKNLFKTHKWFSDGEPFGILEE